MTFTLTHPGGKVPLPASLPTTLAEFREWAQSEEIPEKTRLGFYKTEVWVDMSNEQLYSHALVKSIIQTTLTTITRAERTGICFPDGVLLTNLEANVSNNPDALFVSYAALKDGRVTRTEGARDGYVEIVGTPDLVVEVVSSGSVRKDTVVLREAYWEAGIPEYWLVDARAENPNFRILKSTPSGYAETRKVAGWQKSAVLGKSFRLVRGSDPLGDPEFTLEVK